MVVSPRGRITTKPKGCMVIKPKGRIAPSPTGYMHIGNAWSFLMAWLSIRQQRGTMVLRMEDIDPDRAKPCYADAIMHDLAWLGLNWDEGVSFNSSCAEGLSFYPVHSIQPHAPYIQSQCSHLYIAALDYLAASGHSYPCFCTRKELRTMAGAPHLGEACIYTGTCRHLTQEEQVQRIEQGRKACIRLLCHDMTISFTDRRYGKQSFSLTDCGGDFAIRRSDGVFAYQLAVVVDDMRMGITEIVRGDDLLHCTPRQIYLQSILQQAEMHHYIQPSYLHVPLLLDVEGERFAKRHASLTIQSLRAAGISSSIVIGYLAYLAGFIDVFKPISAQELIPYFDAQRLPTSALRLVHDPFEAMQALMELHCTPDAAYMARHLACEPFGPVLKS